MITSRSRKRRVAAVDMRAAVTPTVTMATELPASWLEIKNDSLESFMSLDFVEATVD